MAKCLATSRPHTHSTQQENRADQSIAGDNARFVSVKTVLQRLVRLAGIRKIRSAHGVHLCAIQMHKMSLDHSTVVLRVTVRWTRGSVRRRSHRHQAYEALNPAVERRGDLMRRRTA